MKRIAFLTAIFTAVLTLVLPFIGGSGPSLTGSVSAAAATQTGMPIFATQTAPAAATASVVSLSRTSIGDAAVVPIAVAAPAKTDSEHLAQKPVPKPAPSAEAVAAPHRAGASGGTSARVGATTAQRRAVAAATGTSCPAAVGGGTGGAPSRTSAGGVAGTTSADLASFASAYNAIRVANCLQPVPMNHIRYDACMETRLFWMAEDPSTNTNSAWGHMGSQRSDGVPSVGCDGNLAGGSGNSGATVAQKWWDSLSHRASLYRPSFAGSTAGVCVYFAMTHGGIPNESYGFTRAAARWGGC